MMSLSLIFRSENRTLTNTFVVALIYLSSTISLRRSRIPWIYGLKTLSITDFSIEDSIAHTIGIMF